MKKHIKMIFAALLLVFVLAPAVKANAAVVTPAKPSGLNIHSQAGSEVGLYWNFDSNLSYYSDVYPGYYGYEVTVKTLKNKSIAVLDSDKDSFYKNSPKSGQVEVILKNSKLKTQGFKFSVRSYVYDENRQKVYSASSAEKVIIPRPTVKSAKMVNKKAKLTYNKVTGAKSYTIYLSSNNGKSFKKIGTTKKTSYAISKNLKINKDYYVYIQANGVKYKGKKYNSTKPLDKSSNFYVFHIIKVYKY